MGVEAGSSVKAEVQAPAPDPGMGRARRLRIFCGAAVLVGVGLSALGVTPEEAWTLGYLAIGVGLLVLLAIFAPWLTRRRLVSWRMPPEAALIIISLFFSAALGEVGLRLFYSHYFPDPAPRGPLQYQHDRTLGWVPAPNRETEFCGRITNNTAGFRGAEFAANRNPSILFLGDSFMWGYEVKTYERFTERLQARHREWNIYNVGVCAYGTDQEYLLLQRVFDKLSPRLVFLQFCTENDQEDNSSNFRWGSFKPYYLTNAAGLQLRGVPVPRTEDLFCADHSLLGTFHLIRLGVRAHLQIASPVRMNPDPTLALLAGMQKFVEGKGAKFALGLTGRHPQIERFLDASGIAWVDLSTDLRLHNDMHWSAAGHNFVADEIEKFLMPQQCLRQ